MQKEIFIKGARENNLKNIDVTIPRDKLVVLTGLSGSGKCQDMHEHHPSECYQLDNYLFVSFQKRCDR